MERYENSTLLEAARIGDLSIIRNAIEGGQNLDPVDPDCGDTPLLIACLEGNTKIALALIHAGADVHYVNNSPFINKGKSAISQAAKSGDTKVVNALLDAGLDIDFGDPTGSCEGMTPLMWAANRGHLALLGFLIERGANVNAKDYRGRNVLCFAANADVVHLLLNAGADPNSTDLSNRTPDQDHEDEAAFYEADEMKCLARMSTKMAALIKEKRKNNQN